MEMAVFILFEDKELKWIYNLNENSLMNIDTFALETIKWFIVLNFLINLSIQWKRILKLYQENH